MASADRPRTEYFCLDELHVCKKWLSKHGKGRKFWVSEEEVFFFSSLDFQRPFKRPGPGGGVFSNIPRQDALLPEIQPDCLEELDSECLEDPLVILNCAD